MKTFTILLGLFLMSLTVQSQPKVITIDNRANSGADYTTLPAAITASIPGDTLHIHPSATSYGVLTTTKRLIIVGLSHNEDNSNNNQKAIVGNVTFQGNSANSLITGMQYNQISTNVITDCSNIRIINNRGGTITGGTNADNWIIEGNILTHINNNSSNGWIIKNNIFNRNTWIIQNFNNTTSFLNNVVINSSDNFALSCSDPIVNNNVFILTGSADDLLLNTSTIAFNNNLTYSPNFNPIPALNGTGNLNETNPNFVNAPFGSITDFYNNDYNVGGSAINAGTDGTDLGVFGALFVFDVQGRPDDFPYMTSLNITNSSVPMGQNIDVTFTAQKKN